MVPMKINEELKMHIMPIKQFYKIVEDSNATDEMCAILMSSYDIDEEKVGIVTHLSMQFDDVSTNVKNSFNTKKAQQIKKFLEENVSNAKNKELYVCCDYGESRSAAVAAAICRYYKQSDYAIWNNPKYHPNPLVYKILCKELGVKLLAFEVKYKIRRNKQSLSRAINLSKRQTITN